MFVTSNHPDRLDPALLRSGRIDLRETIAELDRSAAWEMFAAYRPGATLADFERVVGPRLPIPASALQNLLQSPQGDLRAVSTAA